MWLKVGQAGEGFEDSQANQHSHNFRQSYHGQGREDGEEDEDQCLQLILAYPSIRGGYQTRMARFVQDIHLPAVSSFHIHVYGRIDTLMYYDVMTRSYFLLVWYQVGVICNMQTI